MGYDVAVAHGTVFTDKARSIQNDVSSLQDASILAFQKFKDKSNVALTKLQAAFEHLSNSEEEQAQPLLNEVGNEANDLAREAKNLELKAGTGRDKVSAVLQDIYASRSQREQEKASIEAQERDLTAQKARTEAELRNAQAAAAESNRQADQAGQEAERQRKKKKKACKGLLKKAKCALFKNDEKKYRKRERSFREEAERHLAQARQQQVQAEQALSQLQQIANSLNVARQKIQSIENTAQGLQSINSNYNGLTVALQSTSSAWEDIGNNCQDLKKQVTNKEVVASPTFQESAVRLYAQWLSLNKDSRHFLQDTKPIQAIAGTNKDEL